MKSNQIKKIIVAFCAATLVYANVFAGENLSTDKAQLSFTTLFPKAENVAWVKINNEFNKAVFKLGNETMSAVYDNEGNLVATSRDLKFEALPLPVQAEIKNTYNAYAVNDVIEFVDAENDWSYFVGIENQKEKRILQVYTNGMVTTFKKTRK